MAVVIGILVVAFVAGVFGSMLGVGGGIIMVPVLSLAFGVPIKTAIATSIICVIATSSMAQTTFAARGMTNMRLGMFLEVATTVGALAGGITAVLIDGGILQACFAVLLFYVAWQMSRRRGDVVPVEGPVMPSSYYDPAQGRQVSYGVHGLGVGFALSIVAGNVSGLLGVGGGAFKVPIMNLLMGVPLKATIATSNLMIGVTAATSAAIFYGRGYVDPRWAVPAALGILVGARIGPRFAIHLPARVLVLIFEVVLVVFGVLMLAQGAGGGRVNERPAHVMDPIERLVSRVLGVGIVVAVALMLTGLVLGVAKGEGVPAHVVPLADLVAGLTALDPAAWLSAGLLVLVATPFVRVGGSIVAFAVERDRRYVLVTAVVLAVMCLGVLLGKV